MKRKTIRNHRDFLSTPNDPLVANYYFIIRMKPMVKKDARYGIIAAKRTFRFAVQRNRAKRMLRDWISFNEDLMLPDMDYVFIARSAIFQCERDVGRRKMKNQLRRISKCKKNS